MKITIIVYVFCAFLFGPILSPIVSGQIVLQNSVISNGSARIGNGNQSISTIIGQPAIGSASNSTHTSRAGFLYLQNVQVISKIEAATADTPTTYRLDQNYPNPFNPTTTIQFAVPKQSHVSLKLYDVLGREVGTLVEQDMSAGEYKIEFDGRELPSGLYLYRIQAEGYSQLNKFLLLK